MIERKRYLPIAAAVALALAVTGCLHDDDDAPVTSMMDDPMEEEATPDPMAGLFATAQTARDDADAAAAAAAKAVEAAMKAGDGLTVTAVAGDSAMAKANAQAIMDAQAAAVQAVRDAQAALDSATTAKTEAEGVADDKEHKTSLIAALDAAIKVAEEQIVAATESRDSDDLSDFRRLGHRRRGRGSSGHSRQHRQGRGGSGRRGARRHDDRRGPAEGNH